MWFPPVKIHFNWLDTRNHSMKIPHGKLFHSSAGATAAALLWLPMTTQNYVCVCVSGHIGSRRLFSRPFYIDHYFIRLKSNRDFNSIISIYFVEWRKIKSIYMDIDDDRIHTHTPNHITYAFNFPWLGKGNASAHTHSPQTPSRRTDVDELTRSIERSAGHGIALYLRRRNQLIFFFFTSFSFSKYFSFSSFKQFQWMQMRCGDVRAHIESTHSQRNTATAQAATYEKILLKRGIGLLMRYCWLFWCAKVVRVERQTRAHGRYNVWRDAIFNDIACAGNWRSQSLSSGNVAIRVSFDMHTVWIGGAYIISFGILFKWSGGLCTSFLLTYPANDARTE